MGGLKAPNGNLFFDVGNVASALPAMGGFEGFDLLPQELDGRIVASALPAMGGFKGLLNLPAKLPLQKHQFST
jgi:hypothetical protein